MSDLNYLINYMICSTRLRDHLREFWSFYVGKCYSFTAGRAIIF